MLRRWRRVLSVQAGVSGALSFAVTLLWGLTGGGTFWPVWVWYGLAIPLGLNGALFGAMHVRRRRWRVFAIHAAVSSWISAILVVTWALAGSDEFWPAIPIGCLAMLLSLHAVLAAILGGEEELVERVDELTRTRRGALDVQAHELRRIERDLHDGAQARLVALTMQLGRAEARLGEHPEAAELIREARGEAKEAIAELRDLARGIAPPVLADRGLPAAVEAIAARSAIRASVDARIDHRLPPVVETAAYFVVAESLTNAAKHAGDGARAHVSLRDGAGVLTLEITDDGRGGANPGGSGLTGLRHRVEALDGVLTVTSAEGLGTVIRAELPYN
jgi:signal transduction histidine kinase